jgi:hypothetical protein
MPTLEVVKNVIRPLVQNNKIDKVVIWKYFLRTVNVLITLI